MRPHPAHKFATLSFRKERVQESAPFTKSHSSLRLPLLSEGEGWGEVLLPPRKSQRGWMLGGFLLILLLLTGCGDDRPYTGPPPGSSSQMQTAPHPVLPDPAAPSMPASNAPPDPLIGGSPQTYADPLIGHDPLQGRAMPTAHSHWLSAEMRHVRMTVLLNGVRLGAFITPGTQDVTMKMHSGINTLTVLYAPEDEHSWGSVTMSEGEHGSQAVMLAAFRQRPAAESSVSDTERARLLKPLTKTFTFSAK